MRFGGSSSLSIERHASRDDGVWCEATHIGLALRGTNTTELRIQASSSFSNRRAFAAKIFS